MPATYAVVYDGKGNRVELKRRPRGKSRRTNDTQRHRLYDAEREAFADWRKKADLRTTGQIEIWANRLLRSKRVRKALASTPASIPVDPVRVGAQGGGASAGGGTRWMRFDLGTRNEWMVLHELAHVLTDWRDREVAGHGREYAQVYLALVRSALGKAWHDRLKAAFKKHRVKYTKPRTLSPERRAALVSRLADFRAKRNTISHAPSRSLSVATAIANLDGSYR